MLFFCVFFVLSPIPLIPFVANLLNLNLNLLSLLCPLVPSGALLIRECLPSLCHLCHYIGWLHITQFLLHLWALLLGEEKIPGHPALLLWLLLLLRLLLLGRLLLLRLLWLLGSRLLKFCHHSRHLLLKLSNAVGNDLKGHRHLCLLFLVVG